MTERIKKGFSLIEVMLLFTVLAVIMAASMPVITKKSRPVPRKFSHGAYICYDNGNGTFNQELYTGTRLTEPKENISACHFYVPEAAMYKIDLYSAGAGGYLAAKVDTALNDFRSAIFSTASGGYFNKQYVDNENFSTNSFTANTSSDASPIHQLTEDDLTRYFRDDYIIRSNYTNNAGYGGFASVDYFYPKGSYCLAQAHLKQAVANQKSAASQMQAAEIQGMNNTLNRYSDAEDDVENYIEAFSTFLDTYKSGNTTPLKNAMKTVYKGVKDAGKDYNKLLNVFKGSDGYYTKYVNNDFKDKVEALQTSVKNNLDAKYDPLKDTVSSLKSDAKDRAEKEMESAAQSDANNKAKVYVIGTASIKDAKEKAKTAAGGYDPDATDAEQLAYDAAMKLVKEDVEKTLEAEAEDKADEYLSSTEFADAMKAALGEEYTQEQWNAKKNELWQAKKNEYYNANINSRLDTAAKAKITDVKTTYQNEYNKVLEEDRNPNSQFYKDEFSKKYSELKTAYLNDDTHKQTLFNNYKKYVANGAEQKNLSFVESNTTSLPKIVGYNTIISNNPNYEALMNYNPDTTTYDGILNMKTKDNSLYSLEYQTFYSNYEDYKKSLSDIALAKYAEGSAKEAMRNCLFESSTECKFGNGSNDIKVDWTQIAQDLGESSVQSVNINLQVSVSPVRVKMKDWKKIATDVKNDASTKRIYGDETDLLYSNINIDTITINENNWYDKNAAYVKQALVYFKSRYDKYEDRQKESEDFWKNLGTKLTNLQNTIDQGSLVNILNRSKIYMSENDAYDMQTPESTHTNDPITTDSNTYKQLKAYCRANNIRLFMDTYGTKFDNIEVLEQYKNQVHDSHNDWDDDKVEAAAKKAAYLNFLNETVSGDSSVQDDLGISYNYNGKTYAQMLKDYWDRPIQYSKKSSDNYAYLSTLTKGYGGAGGMGGYLRIKYPIAYISKWTTSGSAGGTIDAAYLGKDGETVNNMDGYLKAMSRTDSYEGRYPVICSKKLTGDVMKSQGYFQVSVVNGNVAAAKELSDTYCKPYAGVNALAYHEEYENKSHYLTTPTDTGADFVEVEIDGKKENLSRDVYADYYLDNDRLGENPKATFLSKSGSNRFLKTYKGMDLKDLEYPFMAWHIPIHGNSNNPYEITAYRNISMVRGIDDLATGGLNKIVYMDESKLGKTPPANTDHKLSKFYDTSGFGLNVNSKGEASNIDSYNAILDFYHDSDYPTVEKIAQTMLNPNDAVAYSIRKKSNVDGDGNSISDGRPTKFTGNSAFTDNGFPTHQLNENFTNRYTTQITAVYAHNDQDQKNILEAKEGVGSNNSDRIGMIAYQDPQIKEMSAMWTKRYYLGKSGYPGKLESTVSTNLGKFCKINVPHGGEPYDPSTEKDANNPRKQLNLLQDNLAITMSCGKNFEEVNAGKNLVFNRTVKGGKYNINYADEGKTFKWSNKYDQAEVDSNGNVTSDVRIAVKLPGEKYEGSTDNYTNETNKQPVWKPTSIWAKIFKNMLAENNFAPAKYGVGFAGDGTTLTDNCTVRKGFYSILKQYERKRFKVNTVTIVEENREDGTRPETEVQISNFPIDIEAKSELETVEDPEKGKYNYTGDRTFSTTEGPVTVNCYFAGNDNKTAEKSGIASAELTNESDYVKAGAYKLEAGNGGGGAVIITW